MLGRDAQNAASGIINPSTDIFELVRTLQTGARQKSIVAGNVLNPAREHSIAARDHLITDGIGLTAHRARLTAARARQITGSNVLNTELISSNDARMSSIAD